MAVAAYNHDSRCSLCICTMSSAVSTTADRTTSRTEPPGHHSCGLRCRQLPEALSYFSPDALLHASGARPRRQCLAGARCPVRVALARGRQPMGDNYVRPLQRENFVGPCQNIVLIYKPDDARVSEEGIALRPQIHSPVPSGRSTCASRSFCAARAAAQPCSICSLTAAHRPLGTRGCTLGARRCRPVRAGVQAGASGVAGGSSVCSPIS